MIRTPDLIDALAADLRPVRRLRPPLVRAALWLALGGIVVVLIAVSQGLRPDIVDMLHDPGFASCIVAPLLTGILSACATFMLSVPDRSRLWCLLPLPGLGLWLATVGHQCIAQWIDIEPGGMRLGETAHCFAILVLTGLPLSLAMLAMVRAAAPLRPTVATLTGSLAVAAVTATAVALVHPLDATLMILIWNLGVAVVFVSFGGVFAGRMFS